MYTSANVDGESFRYVDSNGWTINKEGGKTVATKRIMFNGSAVSSGSAGDAIFSGGINYPVDMPAGWSLLWSVNHNGGNGGEALYALSSARNALYLRAIGGNVSASTNSSITLEYSW